MKIPIYCPECEKEIPEDIDTCPHCGFFCGKEKPKEENNKDDWEPDQEYHFPDYDIKVSFRGRECRITSDDERLDDETLKSASEMILYLMKNYTEEFAQLHVAADTEWLDDL